MWEYVKAVRRGKEVTVTLRDTEAGEEAPGRELTWTKDEGMTWKQFRKMVVQEVRAMLDHLNAQEPEEDVTTQFKPIPPVKEEAK